MAGMELDPLVGKRLLQFKQRRLRLLFARGISAGLLAFAVSFALVAFADWRWLLTDSTRWSLSIASYGLVFFCVWWASVYRIFRRLNDQQLAMLIEGSEPALREKLLSAVELATGDPETVHDSPVFRGLLQDQVAQRMGKVQVSQLLPVRLIRGWLVAAVVLTATVATLLLVGDSRLRQLAVRALMPGANIARISRIQIQVISPSPASQIMANDETVAVEVKTSGGSVQQAFLETFTESQGFLKSKMVKTEDGHFAANIHLREETVEYRVMAGDAITKRFTINTRSRPHILEFHKIFEFPEYTRLPTKKVIENHGDLIVLEGTMVNLKLMADQEISKAEMHINPVGLEEIQKVPLHVSGTEISGSILVDKSSIYKVHLIAGETSFENIFAPKYEIRPQPDLIPKTGFIDQKESTLLLPPNDVLKLRGMAEDDLPLEDFQQQVSINGEDWTTKSLEAQPVDGSEGHRLEAAWNWDLISYQLQPGDEVITKLVALDRKGNRGESIPLRIVIAEQEFDPDRHLTLLRKIDFLGELSSYATAMDQFKTSSGEIVELLLQPERGVPDQRSDLVDLEDINRKQSTQTDILLKKSKELLDRVAAGVESTDMELAALLVERIANDHLNRKNYLISSLGQSNPPNPVLAKELKSVTDRIAADAQILFRHFQTIATHDFLAGLASDLHGIYQQQKRIVATAMDSRLRLLRHQAVVNSKLQELAQLIDVHTHHLPQTTRNQLQTLKSWIESELETIRNSSESEEQFTKLQAACRNLSTQLGSRQNLRNLDGGLPQRLVSSWRDFFNRSGQLFSPIYEAGVLGREIAKLSTSPSDDEQLQLGLKQLEWNKYYRPGLDRLKIRRDINQQRKDSDTQYAADLGLTFRAARFLANQHETGEDPRAHEHLLEIATAFRKLWAGHQLKKIVFDLNISLNWERWNLGQHQALIDSPRQWEAITTGLELASIAMKDAQISQPIQNEVNRLRWDPQTGQANQKILQRRWKNDQPASAATEVSSMRDKSIQIIQEMQPELDEARAIIRKYAPTISDLARQAASDIRELEKQTSDLADRIENQDQNPPQSLQQLTEQQQEINEQIDDLKESIVEDANSQDLLDPKQLERAKDADHSTELLRQPAKEMNQALQDAENSEPGEPQVRQLANAAEKQEKTAQALEQIADHYEKMDRGENIDSSRSALRDTPAIKNQRQEVANQFDQAEKLSQMAQQTPAELMKELEAELQKNPAMQQALSEIARNTLEKAKKDLADAAQKENRFQREIEKSDTKLQQKKSELARELQQAGQEAAKLARELVQQANQAAAQGKNPSAQEQMSQAQKELNDLARKTASASPNQLMRELEALASEAKDSIMSANQALQDGKKTAGEGKQGSIHPDENARKAAQNSLEKQRQQFRKTQQQSAKQQTRNAEAQKRQADNQVKAAQSKLQQTERRLNQAKSQLAQKPDDTNRKNQLAREESAKKADQESIAEAKAQQTKAENRVQEARKAEADLANKSEPKLSQPNPANQLAEQFADEAIKESAKIANKIEKLAREVNDTKLQQASKNQLAQSSQQQEQVNKDVNEIAENLRRSSRHEARLKNESTSESLRDIANQVQKTADQELNQAEKQLEQATQAAEKQEKNPSQPDSRKSLAESAQKSLEKAENALRAQADSLTEMAEKLTSDPTTGQPQQGQPQQGQPQQGQPQQGQPQQGQPQQGQPQQGQPQQGPSQPSAAELARGQQLAETLDELDQQLAESQASSLPNSSSNSVENSGQPLDQASNEATGSQDAPGQPGQSQTPSQTPAGQPGSQPLPSLVQAAQSQQASMANARTLSQQQSQLANSETSQAESTFPTDSQADPSLFGAPKGFEVRKVTRQGKEWGKLRGKSAEGASTGQRERVAEAYRKKVEAYFKVLAERSRKREQD